MTGHTWSNYTNITKLGQTNMLGSKRPRSERSPEPRSALRKVGRWDHGSDYNNVPTLSNPSPRRSSVSHNQLPDQVAYGTPRSPSPSRTSSRVKTRHIEDFPKAFESAIVAATKQYLTSRHLDNVKCDYEEMMPICTDFPGLGIQKANRLKQAQKDFDAAKAENADAQMLFLDAVQGHISEKEKTASHQNCVSRTDFDKLNETLGSLAKRLDDLAAENTKLKRQTRELEDHFIPKTEMRLNNVEDRVTKTEDETWDLGKAVDSAMKKQRDLYEQTSSDRSSCRSRCSALEQDMAKIKTEQGRSRSVLDDHISRSDEKHEAHTRDINSNKSSLESVEYVVKQQSESISAVKRTLKDHEDQTNPSSIQPYPPVASALLEDATSRIAKVEDALKRLEEENDNKDRILADHVQEELKQVEETMTQDLEQKLRSLPAWKDVDSSLKSIESKTNNFESSMQDVVSNTRGEIEAFKLHTNTLTGTIETRLTMSIDEVKRAQAIRQDQGISEEFKARLEHTSQMVDNHVDLLHRHEVRLNSVMTDELVKMMVNQWSSLYGIPSNLRNHSGQLAKLGNAARNLQHRLALVETRAMSAEGRLTIMEKNIRDPEQASG